MTRTDNDSDNDSDGGRLRQVGGHGRSALYSDTTRFVRVVLSKSPYPSRLIRVTLSESSYPSRYSRIALFSSSYPSRPIRVTLSESSYPSHPIGITLSVSSYPSHSSRVALSELPCPSRSAQAVYPRHPIRVTQLRHWKCAPAGCRTLLPILYCIVYLLPIPRFQEQELFAMVSGGDAEITYGEFQVVCVCACVRACVHTCVRACACVCVCVCVCVWKERERENARERVGPGDQPGQLCPSRLSESPIHTFIFFVHAIIYVHFHTFNHIRKFSCAHI